MNFEIIKRDGTCRPFDTQKIVKAIHACLESLNREDAGQKALQYAEKVVNNLSTDKQVTVELVQDQVEKILMDAGEYDAMKSFMIYRYQHQKMRSVKDC
jgi:ribonucleoside-triphosphate reductase